MLRFAGFGPTQPPFTTVPAPPIRGLLEAALLLVVNSRPCPFDQSHEWRGKARQNRVADLAFGLEHKQELSHFGGYIDMARLIVKEVIGGLSKQEQYLLGLPPLLGGLNRSEHRI